MNSSEQPSFTWIYTHVTVIVLIFIVKVLHNRELVNNITENYSLRQQLNQKEYSDLTSDIGAEDKNS